jgi:hypothetical protein
MTHTLPPFTSHPSGRLRQVEYVPSIDASEIAWSGALDGICDPNAWPWSEWAERERWLQERRWIEHGVAMRRFVVGVESETEIRMRVQFGSVGVEPGAEDPLSFGQLLFFQSTPCALGGRRWWFVCWLCGKRRAKLYRPGFQIWECRECWRLTYRSRQDYNADSRHGSGSRHTSRFFDRDETRWDRIGRRNMRRGLSRWREKTRDHPEAAAAWPVQLTTRPVLASTD